MPRPGSRALVALAAALGLVGLLAGGVAWLLDTPQPPPGAARAERLYYAFCVTCHGPDGRGSWRAALFLIRPGDLADRTRMAARTDRHLFDVIKHGGASFGQPGMPAFGFHMPDADIAALVAFLRTLPSGRPG